MSGATADERNSIPLALRSAVETHRRLQSRELSAVEVMEACLRQVERLNGTLNAICTVSERALEEAQAADAQAARGDELGLLHGLPVGIKDVTPTAGLRTTYGSKLFADYVPDFDALVVERLKRAGAIILGKTNTPEFAVGANTFNELFGVTRNPWNPELSAGGSTGGGAAALASGMIFLAQGSDLGGSLRIPAAFCGVVGLRPSPGLVPTWPTRLLWDSLSVTGPMARRTEDVALLLQAMHGPSSRSPLRQSSERDFVGALQGTTANGLRVAFSEDVAKLGVQPEIQAICRRAAFELTAHGAAVEEMGLDLSFARGAFGRLRGEWMVSHHLERLAVLDALGPNLSGNIRAGLEVTSQELAEAERDRGRVWEIFQIFFERFDLLLTPTVAVPPFPAEDSYPTTVAGQKMKTYVDWFAPTFVLSLTALPIASVPCGLDGNGLPVGLQIVGPPEGEEKVLGLAKAIEEACPLPPPALS